MTSREDARYSSICCDRVKDFCDLVCCSHYFKMQRIVTSENKREKQNGKQIERTGSRRPCRISYVTAQVRSYPTQVATPPAREGDSAGPPARISLVSTRPSVLGWFFDHNIGIITVLRLMPLTSAPLPRQGWYYRKTTRSALRTNHTTILCISVESQY